MPVNLGVRVYKPSIFDLCPDIMGLVLDEVAKCKFNEVSNNLEKWPLNTSLAMDKTMRNVNMKFKDPKIALLEAIKERNKKN